MKAAGQRWSALNDCAMQQSPELELLSPTSRPHEADEALAVPSATEVTAAGGGAPGSSRERALGARWDCAR